jgi:hypothetical protein
MSHEHTFLIESGQARHNLVLDGKTLGSFPTLEAAEAEANRIARRAAPGASLRFGLDLKSTLMDLEIRCATLEWDGPA